MYIWYIFKKVHGFIGRHLQKLCNIFSFIMNLQSFVIVSFAMTLFTFYINIWQKIHLYFDRTIALTIFTTEGKTKDRARLRCKPLTGRTHQIRVHLEFHGTPVLGDRLYGGERWERLLLHCFSMSFPSITEIQSSFESTIPPEFKQALNSRVSNNETSQTSPLKKSF